MADRLDIPYHGQYHHPRGPDPLPPYPPYHIKVVGDTEAVAVGDAAFTLTIPFDMDGQILYWVDASITTVGSGITQVQIRNISKAVDMLSTRIQIDSGEYHSDDSSVKHVINPASDDVSYKDRIAIDVDQVGSGARGLEVVLFFN